MLHDRRQRDVERRRKFTHRQSGLLREPHHQRPPRRIGQSGESAVERLRIKLNHMVKYRRVQAGVNRAKATPEQGAPGGKTAAVSGLLNAVNEIIHLFLNLPA